MGATALVAGCAGTGSPDVVDSAEVAAALRAPKIVRVRDAGGPRLPSVGRWRAEGDGIAVPGELILVEGDGFGRQPTLTIGGRATAIEARTRGGGIVARVPAGVPVGDVEIGVASTRGRSLATLPVRRLAVVVHHGRLHVLSVDRDGATPLGNPLEVPGARAVRLSSDGSAAYVVATEAGQDRVVTVDLAAPGGPKVAGTRPLAHRASFVASATDAPVWLVAGDGQVTLWTSRDPRRPAPYEPMPLPKEVRSVRALELSPDGKTVVALMSEGNRLAVLDVVGSPPALKLHTTVDLLPTERLPLVRDLAFSADGETLWVVSGNNAQTVPAVQPTRLTAVRLLAEGASPPATAPVAPPTPSTPQSGASAPTSPGAPPPTTTPSGPAAAAAPPAAAPAGTPPAAAARNSRLLSVWRTQTIPGAAAPLRLAVARGQPLASGTTIRMPPEKAAVFVTAVNDALFKLSGIAIDTPAGAKAALALWHPPQPGMLVRANIDGGGGPLFTTPQLLSAVDLTPDSQLLLTTSGRARPGAAGEELAVEFGVTVAPLWGRGTPTFLPLGPMAPGELKPPFVLGDLRIQP